jgi:hypothetical protein
MRLWTETQASILLLHYKAKYAGCQNLSAYVTVGLPQHGVEKEPA